MAEEKEEPKKKKSKLLLIIIIAAAVVLIRGRGRGLFHVREKQWGGQEETGCRKDREGGHGGGEEGRRTRRRRGREVGVIKRGLRFVHR